MAEDDAAAMVETVARDGLVQVMRDLLKTASATETAGWLGTQLEVSHRLRTDPEFAKRWDIPIPVLAKFLALAYDGLVLYLATGRPTERLGPVLDLIESAVRRQS